jgi:hypothetical protein
MDIKAQACWKCQILIIITIAVAQITYLDSLLFLSHTERVPYHTSILTGQAWVYKLISGHPDQIRHNFGIDLQVFEDLLATLHQHGFVQSHNGVTIAEQLGIFLYTCVTELSSCHVGERFQRLPDTITRLVCQLFHQTQVAH